MADRIRPNRESSRALLESLPLEEELYAQRDFSWQLFPEMSLTVVAQGNVNPGEQFRATATKTRP